MPFFKTALINGRGSARGEGSSGEMINHYNMVRMRVNGKGSLKIKICSFQNQRIKQIKDISMADITDREPTSQTNFIAQRASLVIQTDTINDYFLVNRIIVYSKFFASEYPS